MQAVFRLAEKVALYNSTVLITGESGTGKELIARGIHAKGDRSAKEMIPVNCGGIPESLLESELFGYKKGAFTGADKDKKGLFTAADGGTIFLDEIGELPLSLQVKLLRVLQESEIRPVGDAATRKIDVRVIAATARDLESAVSEGKFREDLYYRLNVVQVRVPSLREWPEDIPLLCRHFINLFNEKFGKDIKGLSPSALSTLQRHSWPGNVRELENVIERAVVLADEPVLLPEHFPKNFGQAKSGTGMEAAFEGYSLKAAQRHIERHLIVKALEETGGNRTQAAKLLEISHPSLLTKMKRYEIDM
jgi:two-component system response regulator AtoC